MRLRARWPSWTQVVEKVPQQPSGEWPGGDDEVVSRTQQCLALTFFRSVWRLVGVHDLPP